MTVKVSTGLRTYVLDTGSLKAGLALAVLRIYSGSAPADADAATTGTLLSEITVSGGGTGLSLGPSAAAGVITKAAETWSDTSNNATGTAGYFRFVVLASDTGVLSTTERRIQGSVGTSGADLNLSSVSLTSGNPQTIDFFSVALPTA